VTGTQIAKVVFSLDKKRRSTLTRPNRNSPRSYVLKLTPSKLPRGKHTVTAVVTFSSATKAAPRTLKTTFLNSRVCRGVTPEGPAG